MAIGIEKEKSEYKPDAVLEAQRLSTSGYSGIISDAKGDISIFGYHDSIKTPPPAIADSISTTLQERGARYGAFIDHATIAQDIQSVCRRVKGWHSLAPDQKQALTVISDKIARILNGDPDYVDNWHDIQGYAKLVEDRLLQK